MRLSQPKLALLLNRVLPALLTGMLLLGISQTSLAQQTDSLATSTSEKPSPETAEPTTENQVKDAPKTKYDRVKVKDTVLQGKLISFDKDKILFDPIYGRGQLTIPYDEIENLISQDSFYFHTGKDSFYGKVISYRDGLFVIQNDKGQLNLVSPEHLKHGVLKTRYDSNLFTKLRYNFPFWKGNVDFSLEHDSTSIDTSKLRFNLTLKKRLAPSRYRIDAYVNYDQEGTQGNTVKTKDERYLQFTYEHNIPTQNEKDFVFIIPNYESDVIRSLNYRTYPSTGVGYRFYQTDNYLVQGQLGVGYILEDFIGYEDRSFVAGHFGAEAHYKFDSGIFLSGRFMFMPRLDDFNKDGLIRTEANLNIPLIDFISLKLQYITINDNPPNPKISNNKNNFLIGLSIDFLN